MRGVFQFLGTGASAGVPVIGCHCAICLSTSPYNKRFRPAGVVRVGGKTLLIDVGPDFREQALRYQIDQVDGLLLTHTHSDHIAGIDDLRIFFIRTEKPVPCLLSKETNADLQKRYYYLFEPNEKGAMTARLDLQLLEKEQGEAEFLGIKIGYMSFAQSGMKITGFRFGNFAYVSDIREYEETIFQALAGVDILVLSALRSDPSPYHLSFEEAIVFARKVGARKTRLTHLSHAVDHEMANRALPANVQLGYDGLELEFSL